MARKPPKRTGADKRRSPSAEKASGRPRGGDREGPYWLFGRHAVLAALANPRRRCHRLVLIDKEDPGLLDEIGDACRRSGVPRPDPAGLPRKEIGTLLAPGAVHQGLALRVSPLQPEIPLDLWRGREHALIVILDQATDPRNVGAVMRSAAAFGALAVVVQNRHAPDETGVLAKAASGALETVPLIQATNLVRAMEEFKAAGFWCLGLDGKAKETLDRADVPKRVVLVLGAEGRGLRRLVAESCDLLVRIPISRAVESLNISNAAAIAIWECARRHISERNHTIAKKKLGSVPDN